MIRMNVNRILPLMLLLVLFASCSRKYKVEGCVIGDQSRR